jgi:hypothetical protein
MSRAWRAVYWRGYLQCYLRALSARGPVHPRKRNGSILSDAARTVLYVWPPKFILPRRTVAAWGEISVNCAVWQFFDYAEGHVCRDWRTTPYLCCLRALWETGSSTLAIDTPRWTGQARGLAIIAPRAQNRARFTSWVAPEGPMASACAWRVRWALHPQGLPSANFCLTRCTLSTSISLR